MKHSAYSVNFEGESSSESLRFPPYFAFGRRVGIPKNGDCKDSGHTHPHGRKDIDQTTIIKSTEFLIDCLYTVHNVHIPPCELNIYSVRRTMLLCVCRWCWKHHSLLYTCTFEYEDSHCHSLFGAATLSQYIYAPFLPWFLPCISPKCSFSFSFRLFLFRNSIFTIHIVWIEIFGWQFCMQCHLRCVVLFLCCCCCFIFTFFYCVVKYFSVFAWIL